MSAVTALSATPVRADEDQLPSAPLSDSADAGLLQGLGLLADLINDASETLNQCLSTIENQLRALPAPREEWIPLKAVRSAVELALPPCAEQASQERMFGGVSVTIMKFGALTTQFEKPRCQWHYELGYSATGDEWALMIRTSSADRSNQRDGSTEFSDLMALRDASLEIRLKAIREIPDLIQLLDGKTKVTPDSDAVEPPSDMAIEEVVHRAAS